VVFCAAARTPLTMDVRRVEEEGVANLSAALQARPAPRAASAALGPPAHPPLHVACVHAGGLAERALRGDLRGSCQGVERAAPRCSTS